MDTLKISESDKSSTHELMVNNVVYREYKGETSEIRDGEEVVTLTHSRQIGDKKYEVIQVCKGDEILEEKKDTDLTEEELQNFVNDWNENFKPTFIADD